MTKELAASSVLLVIRSPLGAIGMMSIPKDKYDAIGIIRIMESPPCIR